MSTNPGFHFHADLQPTREFNFLLDLFKCPRRGVRWHETKQTLSSCTSSEQIRFNRRMHLELGKSLSLARNKTEVKQLYQQQEVRFHRSTHIGQRKFFTCISTNPGFLIHADRQPSRKFYSSLDLLKCPGRSVRWHETK